MTAQEKAAILSKTRPLRYEIDRLEEIKEEYIADRRTSDARAIDKIINNLSIAISDIQIGRTDVSIDIEV
ncbi:MAG TPA: hypothetical protein PK514_14705 [Spirochaetota bacterium]|nr:hypothetical protein [Spirochaetota bacterium]